MIQLHNLSVPGTNTPATGSNSNSTNQTNLDSFETALSDAIAATFQKFGIDPNSVNISITPESSGSNTTTSDTTSSTSTSTAAPSAPAPAGYDPFAQAVFENAKAPGIDMASTAASTNSSTTAKAAADPTQSFDDAYWAKQPAAVQALRNVQDPELRASMARDLAAQGYTIDVPIMVWGWDPSIATSLRQSFGYTWVPSGLQNPVQIAPGVAAMGGMQAYDPNHPPAGSIMV